MDWLNSISIVGLGQGGLLVIVVLMFLRGWIVPRKTLEDVRIDRTERLRDKDAELERLKEAFAIIEQANKTISDQNSQLMETARTTEAILRALPRSPRR